MTNLGNKTVLVTGGTGSLGQVLVKYLSFYGAKEVRVYSRDEYKQSEMIRKIDDPRITYWLGDIRDLERLKEACDGVDIIYHVAAFKRMDIVSHNAYEVADVNIRGTKNVVIAGKKCERIVLVSTDKAHKPICVYGYSKAIAEAIVLAEPNGVVWRFGNFINSRGSVWEIFEEQKKTGVLTVTDRETTRFFIDINDVCKYLLENVKPGLHYPKNLKSVRIMDLAMRIAPGAEYKITGLRPGDKLHEAFDDEYTSDKCL